ncbi:MAG: PIG-L family deacetylase [Lachnospiraceae bacterium]|nr:PIG-L family deacetylase [Lachnospiraceae bacterium]MBR6349791.1 PIG-L family deacetylase [Lachnospiraceae bacterium]
MIKKLLFTTAAFLACILAAFAIKAHAEELEITVESSDGYPTDILTDDDFNTTDYYRDGTTITITAEEPIAYVYIKWDTIPGAWKLKSNASTQTLGKNDFLHELVKVESPSPNVDIEIVEDHTYIADIYAFSSGDLPDWVQTWEAPWEKADFLILSAHSDDEILFMGSIAPTYLEKGDYRVQVAYLVDFSQEGVAGVERYRRHELLDGLWELGITHYPQLGEFTDKYSKYDLDEAMSLEDMDAVLGYVVRTIRRFKPQVVVTHDVDGEYGHGQHMVLSKAVRDAVEITNDSTQYPESASTYGTWDVPKTYLHLYSENQIEIDARVPLDKYGGRTALEVAQDAYRKHLSQQWMDFYVSDGYDDYGDPSGYEYSFAKFGLYRSTVGEDTGNDMMEHLTPYAEQAPEVITEPTEETSEEETTAEPSVKPQPSGVKKWLKIALIIVAVLIVIVIVLIVWSAMVRAKKRKLAEERRRRRMQQQRRDRNR